MHLADRYKREGFDMSQPSAFEQVCFIAFFATLPLYSPNMIFSPDLAGFDLAMPYFVHSTLATAMVAGMAAACIALCAKEPSRITFLTPLRMTIVALLYLTGLFLLFASLLLPGVPVELCSLLGGTLCGTTTLLLCIAWGSVFSTLTFREALIRLSVLLAICALINTGFVYMGSETGVASFLLLSILGLVPLLIRSTHGEFVRLLNVQRDAKSQDSTVFHSFFSVALGPFVGFLLFALTMAVRKIAVFGNMYAESIGTILAVVSVLPLWLRKSDKPLLPFVLQIYLPIFAAILLFLSSFPTGHAVHSIGMIGIYVFFGAMAARSPLFAWFRSSACISAILRASAGTRKQYCLRFPPCTSSRWFWCPIYARGKQCTSLRSRRTSRTCCRTWKHAAIGLPTRAACRNARERCSCS